mgnify:CR=1 FL=1
MARTVKPVNIRICGYCQGAAEHGTTPEKTHAQHQSCPVERGWWPAEQCACAAGGHQLTADIVALSAQFTRLSETEVYQRHGISPPKGRRR